MITDPTERARRVQTMFSRITRRYDLMNRVMSTRLRRATAVGMAGEIQSTNEFNCDSMKE